MSLVDEDGTPTHRLFAGRVHDRLIAELLGLAKGVICDGEVTDGEAVALKQWLRSHPDAASTFPGSVIAGRLEAIFADGILEAHERDDLADLLRSLTGETEDQRGELDRVTRLPIDVPAPSIFFDGKTFCFTGKFVYGSRARCQAEIAHRGGRCADAVTETTDYLVLGTVASPAWVQGVYGTKIERAVELKAHGRAIAILAEEHWVEALQLDA